MATESKESELLFECYKQFERHCQRNDFQFNIDLQHGHLQSFQGPIELATTANKGRCWIATKPIKRGQLILIEKAFVYSSREQHSFVTDAGNHHHAAHENDELVFDETALLLAQLIKHKLAAHPQHKESDTVDTLDTKLISKLKYLYPREHEIGDMDEFEPQQFGIESKHDLQLFHDALAHLKQSANLNETERDTLLHRLPYLIYYNAMVVTQNTEQLCYFRPIYHVKQCNEAAVDDGATNKEEKEEAEYHCSCYADMIGDAIFLKGSFFNHDCQPNATRYFIGDILVVRAHADIASGQELTFSYLESEYLCESESFRANRLPFDCYCNKCVKERSEKRDTDSKEEDEQEEEDEEEEDDESDDDDVQIFDDERCKQLMCHEPLQRMKLIDELLQAENVRFTDIMSGYSAKAMACLELEEYHQAEAGWMQCIGALRQSFGDIHENLVAYWLQVILCKISALIHDLKEIEKMSGVIRQNAEIMTLIKQTTNLHAICFGGGLAFFLRRYTTELSFSRYLSAAKDFYLWQQILNIT